MKRVYQILLLSILLRTKVLGTTECDSAAEWQSQIRGREVATRLAHVNVLLVRSEMSWRKGLRNHKYLDLSLYLPPFRIWTWVENTQPPLDEKSVFWFDFGTKILTIAGNRTQWRGQPRPIDPMGEPFRNLLVLMQKSSDDFLKFGKCTVDDGIMSIEVQTRNSRFVFHARDGLPFSVRDESLHTNLKSTHELSEYRDFGGFLLPTVHYEKPNYGAGSRRRVSYEINPAYDPRLFEVRDGLPQDPDSWRPRSDRR